VARLGEERKLFTVLGEIPMERDHSEDRGVDGRMGSELLLAGGGDGVH
jgi:hypothetical protein